ncbi:hypothetical protein FHT40_004645 [Mycolicibacterium sp. BK556]|uniref:hypothetical protein n=1 Tax=unclassified Mycolicibacterium TaxID=2636767 RepID=UPI001610E689|nr:MULTISPECIES: hypothetical protein [unclassified Mycolicibacterium]MBB3604961.1 hypothetical protein [Mycolicibacterium sp. BK556]MBB3635157.1 hypothetical protein [Mycolicibacterium sp. BK607]MBB3748049.1 hypothetical protein [Mycolicibacterium sp. BK634]
MTVFLAIGSTICVSACSDSPSKSSYGAAQARIGESLALLGWNISVADFRWAGEFVLVNIDAAPTDPAGPHTKPEDLRFGLYGTLAHPVEATGLGSCDTVQGVTSAPLSASGQRLTGTVCIGPVKEQSAVRGVYGYSPRDRIAGTTAAYPAAFPVGLLPTNKNDTGLTVMTTSVDGFRADGTQLTEQALGDPTVFAGKGYMLLGLQADAGAGQYRDDSVRRGGPMMLVAAPSLPGPGLSPACAAYGASVLVLPDASLDAVRVNASLCTQGDINEALLYATVSVIGTHAAVWVTRE